MILEQLIKHAKAYAQTHHIKIDDFGVTASMIYVIVSNEKRKTIGVTLVPHGEGPLGALEAKEIEEVFEYAKTFQALSRAFALALVNAIGQHAIQEDEAFHSSQEGARSLLVDKILELTHVGDEVVFIGHLAPVVAKLKEERRTPIVFCRQKQQYNEHIYSDIFEYEAIQKAPIAIITGATLIGSTLDALLALSPKNSVRIVAGFSAGAHPKWFEGMGVTHIASMKLDVCYKEALLKNRWEDVFSYTSYISTLKH